MSCMLKLTIKLTLTLTFEPNYIYNATYHCYKVEEEEERGGRGRAKEQLQWQKEKNNINIKTFFLHIILWFHLWGSISLTTVPLSQQKQNISWGRNWWSVSSLLLSSVGAVWDGLLFQQADSQRAEAQGKILSPGPDHHPPAGQDKRAQLCEMCLHALITQVRMYTRVSALCSVQAQKLTSLFISVVESCCSKELFHLYEGVTSVCCVCGVCAAHTATGRCRWRVKGKPLCCDKRLPNEKSSIRCRRTNTQGCETKRGRENETPRGEILAGDFLHIDYNYLCSPHPFSLF